jgi:hypothetical protein
MSLLSEYTETDIQSFNISNPTPPVKPPIDNIQTIAYNGSYWIAGGFDTMQTRSIYSFTPSDNILNVATRVDAYLSNLKVIRQILTNVDPTLYSIPIRRIRSSITNNTAYYKSLLNSASSKFKSLKTLGYTSSNKEYCTIHTLMISYDGINWQLVEQNPFQFMSVVDNSYKSNFTNSQYRACVKDIKWNSTLSLWVAVGFNPTRRLWNGTGWTKTFGVQIVEGSNVSDYNPTVGDSTTLTLDGNPILNNTSGTITVSPRTLIATSPDGLIWTSRGTPYLVPDPNTTFLNLDTITCFKVACSETLTIVLGNFITATGDQYIATSTDCINWSIQPKMSSNLGIIPKSIAYNGALWVIVGDQLGTLDVGVRMQISTTGTSWTNKVPIDFNEYPNFKDVAWNGTTWMAIGQVTDNNVSPPVKYYAIYTSSTGLVWERINRILDEQNYVVPYMSLVWDGSFWFINFYPGNVNFSYKTQDGISLFPLNIATSAICTNIPLPILGGKIDNPVIPSSLIVGYGLPTSVLRSSDETDWISTLLDIEGSNFLDKTRKDLFSVVWCNSFWLLVGNPLNNSNGKSVVTSTDGFTWSYPSTYLNGVSTNIVSKARDVAWTGSLAIVVGDAIATSIDGNIWTRYNSPFPMINAIAWNGKTTRLTVTNFAASSNGRQVVTVTSNSGISVGETISIRDATDVLNNGTFLITALGTNTFTWANTIGVSRSESSTVYAYSSLYVAGADNGKIAISVDANSWLTTTQLTLSTVYDIAWNGSIWVAVGVGISQCISVSIDGIRWYTANTDRNLFTQCNAVAWNRSLWVAVGIGKSHTIATSVDGYNWVGRGNNIFNTSGDMIAFNGTNWIAGGTGFYQLASSTDGITWSGINEKMVISRCYANKTTSLPYTGTTSAAVKTVVDQGLSTITTLTNNTPELVQTLNNPFVTEAALAALAAAEAVRIANANAIRLATKISATKYIWEYIYWNYTVKQRYDYYLSQKNFVSSDIGATYSSITNFDSLVSEIASLPNYLSGNLSQILDLYSTILNDSNDQTILDKTLLSIYTIHSEYKSNLVQFYENLRNFFYVSLYEIYTKVNTFTVDDTLLDTIGYTANTEKTKSSVLSDWNGSKSLLASSYTTARNFFITPITTITFTPQVTIAKYTPPGGGNTINFRVIRFTQSNQITRQIITVESLTTGVTAGGTITIENAENSANNGTYAVFSASGNLITWENYLGVTTSASIFESGIGNTTLSYILSVSSSNAPTFTTQFNNFNFNGVRVIYLRLQDMKDTRINVIDKYYNDTKVALIEWKTLNNFDFTTGTTFSAPSNGVQTITVNQIENIQVNRVVTITGATNSTNNVKAALVLSVSGNTFTIQNSTGVAASSQTAKINYSDTAISYTGLDADFNTLKTTGEIVGTQFGLITINKSITSISAFSSWGSSLISFYTRKSKYYYDNYSNVYNYSNDLYRLSIKFKYSLNLLEFDRKDAISYAEQQLNTVRNEVNYFNLTTRQSYSEELLTMRNHYLRLLTTAVYDSSLYERVLKLSDIIFIASRIYPTYSTYLQNVDLSIILAEADGCKPSINGWGGALYTTKLSKKPQLEILNTTGVASTTTQTAVATFVFVPKIIGFGTPKVNGFQEVYTSKIDDPVDRTNINIGTFISITGASNSLNNVTNSTICGFDVNTGTILIYNLKGVASTNQNAKGFRTCVITSFSQPIGNIQTLEIDPNNSSLVDDISLQYKYITITGASNSGNNSTIVTNTISFSDSSSGTQVVQVESISGILVNNYITILDAIESVNNGTYVVTDVGTYTFTWTNPNGVQEYSSATCTIRTRNYVSLVRKQETTSVAVPGKQQGTNGWLYFNNVYYAIQARADFENSIGRNTGSVGLPYSLVSSEIQAGDDGSVTISGNSNTNNNGTFKISNTNGTHIFISNSTLTASAVLIPLKRILFGTSNIRTFTTNVAHNLSLGNPVSLPPFYNNTYTVSSIPSGTTFTSVDNNYFNRQREYRADKFSAPSSNGIQTITYVTYALPSNRIPLIANRYITIRNATNSTNNVTNVLILSVSGNDTFTIQNSSGVAAINQPASITYADYDVDYSLSSLNATAFSALSNGLQTITVTSIQDMTRFSFVTITGASNSANNVSCAMVEVISGNTFSIRNPNGVAATNQSATIERFQHAISLGVTSSATYGTATISNPIITFSESKDGKQRIFGKLQIGARVGDSITITGSSYSANNVTNAIILDIIGNMISISNQNGVYEYGTNATFTTSYSIFEITSLGRIDISRNLIENNSYKPFQYKSIRNTYDGNKKAVEWDIFKNFTDTQTVGSLQRQITDFDTEIDGLRADDEFTEAFMNTKRDNDIEEIENTYLTSATTYLNSLDVKISSKIPTATSLTITAFSALTTNPLVTVLERSTSSPSVLVSTTGESILSPATSIIGGQQTNSVTYQTLTVNNVGTIEPYKNSITITGASNSANNVTRALVIDVVGNTIKIINPNGVAATSQTATGKYGDLVDFGNKTWEDSASLQSMVTTLTTAYNTFLTIKNTPLTAITTTKTITSFGTVNTSYISIGDNVYYNTQVITVNSIGNIIPRMTIRITGAANSNNNGTFKVLQVSGNTFTIENSRGVAATSTNAGSASYISFDYSLTTAENAITTINEIQETEAYITMVKGIEIYRKRYTNAINLVRRVGRNLARWLNMKSNALKEPYSVGVLSDGRGKPFIMSIPPTNTNYWTERPYTSFVLVGEESSRYVSEVNGSIVTVPPIAVSDVKSYSQDKNYSLNDYVSYNGNVYCCIKDDTDYTLLGIKGVDPLDIASWEEIQYPDVEDEFGNILEATSENFPVMIAADNDPYTPTIKYKNGSIVSGYNTAGEISTFYTPSNGTQKIRVKNFDGIVIGETITITGASDPLNNGTFTIVSYETDAVSGVPQNNVVLTKASGTSAGLGGGLNPNPIAFYRVDTLLSFTCIRDFFTDRTITNIPPSDKSYYWVKRTYPNVLYKGEKVEANFANFQSLAQLNNTPTYDNTKTYGKGDTVKYNNNFYYFRTYNDSIYVQGKPPGTTFPRERSWYELLGYSTTSIPSYSTDSYYQQGNTVKFNNKNYFLKSNLDWMLIKNRPPGTAISPIRFTFSWVEQTTPGSFVYSAYSGSTLYENGSRVSFQTETTKYYLLRIVDTITNENITNIAVKNRNPNFGSSDIINATWIEIQTTPSTYLSNKTGGYANGDTVLYNNKYYYYEAPIGFNINGINPETSSIASEVSWQQITHPMVFTISSTSLVSGQFLECNTGAFPALNYNDYPVYSSTTTYTKGDIVRVGQQIFEVNLSTFNVIGINIMNRDFWRPIRNPRIKYNNQWMQYSSNLIPKLDASTFTPYNSELFYLEGSVVSYNVGTSAAPNLKIFRCINDNPRSLPIKGKLPTSTNFWKQVTYPLTIIESKLIEANPTNPIFKKLNELDYHEYENNWLYNKGDLVSYNGLVYECTNVNPNNIAYTDSVTGKSPLTTSGFWEQFSTSELDFINNRYYKTNNILPWNPVTTKNYATGTTVLWKGYLYKSQREISYKAIIDLNSTDDNELLKSYVPSINETMWRKINTDLPTNIPKVYSNTATYYLGSEVMIHDFSDVESVITSITSPFRIRIFKLIGFNKYEPQKYKYPELRILNELDSEGFYKRAVVSGTSSQNGTPRYGLRTIDPFRLENFAGDLKRRVTHNVLLPYLHARNNAKMILSLLTLEYYAPRNTDFPPIYLSPVFIDWAFPQAFNFKDNAIAPDFAETVSNKLRETAQTFINIFNLSETDQTAVTEPTIMPVSAFSASSNGIQVVTVLTTNGKGLRVGDIVTILSASNNLNNGSYAVTDVTLTTFTWRNPVGVSATEILTDEQRVNSFFTRDKSITKGSIQTVLSSVYFYLTKSLIQYRQNVITYQTNKNVLKTRYYNSPFFQKMLTDDPYPYLNVVALAQNPPVRCVKDLGVGDPEIIEKLEKRGKIPEGSLDSYYKQKEELDGYDAKMNIELFNIKTLINYNVIFHYTDGLIGADIKLPIDYYYIDGYIFETGGTLLEEPSISVGFFILGPDDWNYKNMKSILINDTLSSDDEEGIIADNEQIIKGLTYGEIVNSAMKSSLEPPEYTLPGSQAQRDILLLTWESKDPYVNALGKVAKGLTALCSAAFQAGDMASGIFPIIQFIGNWAITGKPDGEVTEDMPGGRDFIKFSLNTQGMSWPQFNERSQSIRNVKEEVKAYRNRVKAAKLEVMTEDDDENLGDALITIGALILLYQTELAELEEIIDFELNIETTITQKTIKYPTLLDPQEPTKITIDIPPKPTKVQIAYGDLNKELKKLKVMYQIAIVRNQELELIKRKNSFIDAQNGKIKTINDGITQRNAITQVEKATLNKRIRYLQSEIDLIGNNIIDKTSELNNQVLGAARAQSLANPPNRPTAILGDDVARQRNISKITGQKVYNARGEVIDFLPQKMKTVKELKLQEPTQANILAAEEKRKELLRQLNEAKEELAKKKLDTFLESQKKLGIFDRVDVENIKKNIVNVLQQIEDIKTQNAAISSELSQYLDNLVDAEAKQAAADLEYNKKKIEYEQQKLAVKNAQNAFDRDIAAAELEAKRGNFLQKKIIKDNVGIQYTFAKNQFTVKYLESETISTIMKRNMPPAVIAQYNDIINSVSTNVTTPIGNAYKSMMTNLKSNIVARTVSVQYKRLNTSIKPYIKSAIPSKYANLLKIGGGPLMELAGIAVTTYSMLKDDDERLDGDTTDPFAEIAGRALEGVADGILQINPYAGV